MSGDNKTMKVALDTNDEEYQRALEKSRKNLYRYRVLSAKEATKARAENRGNSITIEWAVDTTIEWVVDPKERQP